MLPKYKEIAKQGYARLRHVCVGQKQEGSSIYELNNEDVYEKVFWLVRARPVAELFHKQNHQISH